MLIVRGVMGSVCSGRVIVWTLVAAATACTSGPPPPVDRRPYEQQVLSARAAKDTFFRTSADSPIPAVQRATFPGLPYFPVDPVYRVPASLTVDGAGEPVTIELPTSTNDRRRMLEVGRLEFSLAGQPFALTAFAESARSLHRLFVPFGDLTNRSETYGGGRYLDLDRTATGLYDLDFNRAYHPTCVYDPTYDCPVPPRENRLAVAIPAGERLAP
jgi:hypothetical protein